MSLGCENDAGVHTSFAQLKRELGLWGAFHNAPVGATFELTPYCNLNCPMCYVHLDPARAALQGKHLTGKQWLEIARQSADMGTLQVTLTGGEPFLHPDFWEIYEGIVQMGILPIIYTNGCLIDEKIVERFKAFPPHNIKISIYGASDQTYEAMCGVKNGFTRLSHAIDLLKEAGIPFYTTATMVRENVQDLGEMYRFAVDKQISFTHTFAVTGNQRDAISTPHESRLTNRELRWSLEALEAEKRPERKEAFAFCTGYGTSYCITWHGRMTFCNFAHKPYVRITDPIDLKQVWEEMLAKTRQIKVPAECATCEYYMFCKRCPGLLASESGDPEKATPSFCQQAKDMYEQYVRLKAEKEAEGSCPTV